MGPKRPSSPTTAAHCKHRLKFSLFVSFTPCKKTLPTFSFHDIIKLLQFIVISLNLIKNEIMKSWNNKLRRKCYSLLSKKSNDSTLHRITLEYRPGYTREEATRVQNHGCRHLVSENLRKLLSVQKILSGSGRSGRLRLMGKYIGRCLVARPEQDNTFRADNTQCIWCSQMRNKMVAQCLVSRISRPLYLTPHHAKPNLMTFYRNLAPMFENHLGKKTKKNL